MFPTAAAAYRSPTFAVQLAITMLINFGVNFGLEWAFMSQWGKQPNTALWPRIPALRFEAPLNSCLALDLLLTPFMIGWLCTLFATDGTQKEVREKKCDVLDPAAIEGGWWALTPVPIKGLQPRALATGLWAAALFGVPTFLIAWAAVGAGAMDGYAYTCFKGCWAPVVSAAVYALVFPAAISKSCFPELEFQALMETMALNADAPPLVANPALV